MKVVGRVKSEGLASPEQVGIAAKTLACYLEEQPPISEDTFQSMISLATKLNNQTLLQQCKVIVYTNLHNNNIYYLLNIKRHKIN